LGKKDMEISFQLEHRPKVLPLTEVVEETPTIKTFYVNSPEIASKSDPGQFLMLWIVGVDEIPIIGAGGVTNGEDMIEYILAGASAVEIGTGIMERDLEIFEKVCKEASTYLEDKKIEDLIGLAHKN